MYRDLFSPQSVQDLLTALPTLPFAVWETFYVTVVSVDLFRQLLGAGGDDVAENALLCRQPGDQGDAGGLALWACCWWQVRKTACCPSPAG